jgi:hypothetical protein
MRIINPFKNAMVVVFVLGVSYALINSISLSQNSNVFWDSLNLVYSNDTVSIEISTIIKPPSGRLGASSAPILTTSNERILIRAEINNSYDPSRSSIVASIESGDSILFPFKKDTILLKKQNSEMLYYKIIYPEK